jgi:Zn2+/Cd2+-exporting ATPase
MACSHNDSHSKKKSCSSTFPPLLFFQECLELLRTDNSPFLNKKAKAWGKNLSIKASLLSLIILLVSLPLKYSPSLAPISYWLISWVYFLLGTPALLDTLEHLKLRKVNIDLLMTAAAFISLALGSAWEGALLLVLFSLSSSIEKSVFHKARSSLEKLHELTPQTAQVIKENGSLTQRAVQDVTIGTRILIPEGELVPLDGYVIDRSCSVNLSHLTGESYPITKNAGDQVLSGSQMVSGSLILEVSQTYKRSTLAKIVKLIEDAQDSKPPIEQWIDRFSSSYSLSILCLFFLFIFLLPAVFSIPIFGSEGSLYRSLSFLIVASPCSLILGPPIAYLSAVSTCGKQGILIKTKHTFDALTKTKCMAFDKTGTLTKGSPTLTKIIPLQDDADTSKALKIAFSLEVNSSHPLAKAISKKAEEQSTSTISLEKLEFISGYGIKATSTKYGDIHLGSPSFVKEFLSDKHKESLEKSIEHNLSLEMIAVLSYQDQIFLFLFEDPIRPQVTKTIKTLKEIFKLNCIMLTGDRKITANSIGKQTGINTVFAELSPEEKLSYVRKYSKDNFLTYIGDGINDTPSLAQAHVGISMGKIGTAASHAVSDIVLLQDNLENLPWLINHSKRTLNIVKQNVIFSLIVITLTSFSSVFGYIPLWSAVILHEGGTVLVSLNGLRLLSSQKNKIR